MTPGDLYRTCQRSAYRLETLQHYIVPSDQERQAAFHAGQPLPPARPEKQDDLRLISTLRQAGREIGRVHIVTWPLSDYVRYELAIYAENAAAGEYVRIADATAHPQLAELTRDFAIFDAETSEPNLVLFNYSPDGQVLGYEHTQNPALIAERWRQYLLAYDLSQDLADFAATHELPQT